MHKEIVKRQGNTVLIIVGLIVLIFICMTVLENISIEKYGSIVDMTAVGLLTFLVFVVLRYKIVDFKYVLIDKDLIFRKLLGNNETVLLNVNIADILMIAPVGSKAFKQYRRVEKTYRLNASLFGKNKYCGIFNRDGKYYKFTFEPSAKLVKLLKRSIPDKVFE